MNYTNLAMITAVVVGGTSELKDFKATGKPAAKPIVAAFIIGIFLFILGMASESVATKFCYLIIVTAILKNGTTLFNTLNTVSNPKQKGK